MKPWPLVLLLCAALAGCVSPPPAGGAGGGDIATVPMEVRSASLVPGRCFDGAQEFGDVCHVLTVRLDNSGRANRLSTTALTWHAAAADGRTYDFGASDADSVAGGSAPTLTVRFTTPDGAAKLVRLEYRSPAARADAAVPPY